MILDWYFCFSSNKNKCFNFNICAFELKFFNYFGLWYLINNILMMYYDKILIRFCKECYDFFIVVFSWW